MDLKIESLHKEPYVITVLAQESTIETFDQLQEMIFQTFALIFDKTPSLLKILKYDFLPLQKNNFYVSLQQEDPYRWNLEFLDLNKKVLARTAIDVDIGADLGC